MITEVDKFEEVLAKVDFPVSLHDAFPCESEDTSPVGKKLGKFVVREDTGEAISWVTDQYKLITHGQVFRRFLTELGSTFLYPKKVSLQNNGTRALMVLRSNRVYSVGKLGDGSSDNIFLELYCANSYDRTSRFWYRSGVWRQVCTNGAIAPVNGYEDLSLSSQVIHMGDDVEEQMSQLSETVATIYDRFEESVERLRNLRLIELDFTSPSLVDTLKELFGPQATPKMLKYAKEGKGQDGSETGYSLFNGVSQLLTERWEKSKNSVDRAASNLQLTQKLYDKIMEWSRV
jgi:hypothetical protein